jgi:hypothetical protein
MTKHLILFIMSMAFVTPVCAQAVAGKSVEAGFETWIKNSIETPQTTAYLSGKSTELIDAILGSGRYVKIGELDLVALRKEMKTVKWRAYVGKPIVVGPGGSRSTAVYSVKQRLVVVSREEWFEMDEAIRQLISLHEGLGALGYRDEKYQITLSISLLASLLFADEFQYLAESQIITKNLGSLWSTALSSRPVTDLQKTDQTPVYILAGGVSLTGGAGDEHGISIKAMALLGIIVRWKLAEARHVAFAQVFAALLDADVERTINEVKLGQPLIDNTKIKYDGKLLMITVPKNDKIIYPRTYSIASDYMGYLCDEIIIEMEKFYSK